MTTYAKNTGENPKKYKHTNAEKDQLWSFTTYMCTVLYSFSDWNPVSPFTSLHLNLSWEVHTSHTKSILSLVQPHQWNPEWTRTKTKRKKQEVRYTTKRRSEVKFEMRTPHLITRRVSSEMRERVLLCFVLLYRTTSCSCCCAREATATAATRCTPQQSLKTRHKVR